MNTGKCPYCSSLSVSTFIGGTGVCHDCGLEFLISIGFIRSDSTVEHEFIPSRPICGPAPHGMLAMGIQPKMHAYGAVSLEMIGYHASLQDEHFARASYERLFDPGSYDRMKEEKMIKSRELSDPNSCMSKAKDDEMTFVLLGRDAAAPDTIRFWCERRIALGKNKPDDPQITEALQAAASMEIHSTEGA